MRAAVVDVVSFAGAVIEVRCAGACRGGALAVEA